MKYQAALMVALIWLIGLAIGALMLALELPWWAAIVTGIASGYLALLGASWYVRRNERRT